jgi:hypothetical protein
MTTRMSVGCPTTFRTCDLTDDEKTALIAPRHDRSGPLPAVAPDQAAGSP